MRFGASEPVGGASRRRRPVSSAVHVSREVAQGFCATLPFLKDVAEPSNSFTFDYCHGQTTPSALPFWSSDWTVGGSLHVFNAEENAVGCLSFASSPFFRLRLQCEDTDHLEDFLTTLRSELIKDGQWLGIGVVKGDSTWKFAPSSRSFSGTAIARAFERAGWQSDRVCLWLFSYGAKMDIADFYDRVARASLKHEHDVGFDRALLFEQEWVVDIGCDRFTTSPVVVCPDMSKLPGAPFDECSVHLTPMWGHLGCGLGGFFLEGLTGDYLKAKVYNKHPSLWRADRGMGFILGRPALFGSATVDFLSGRFKDTIDRGLYCIINGEAVHYTRVEVRRRVAMSLRDQSWIHETIALIRKCASAIRVREIQKRDLINYCQAAYDTAIDSGLFSAGASHMAEHRVKRFSAVARWQLLDGNRLAYALGWVYVRDVLAHYHADLNRTPWGPRGSLVYDAVYMLPSGFSIPDDYVCSDPPVAVRTEFTHAAHQLAADGINWAAVSPDDADAARELRHLAMYLSWSRHFTRHGNIIRFQLNLRDAQDLGTVRTWPRLEHAVVDLLTTGPGGERFNYRLFKAYQPR